MTNMGWQLHLCGDDLRDDIDLDAAGRKIANSLSPGGLLDVIVRSVSRLPEMPPNREYEIGSTPKERRARAKGIGLVAPYELRRAFDAHTQLIVPLPLHQNTRRVLEVMTMLDAGASDFRVDLTMGRLFRNRLLARYKDITISRVLRDSLPRVRATTHSTIPGRTAISSDTYRSI
jgi:hypothetical protein